MEIFWGRKNEAWWALVDSIRTSNEVRMAVFQLGNPF